MKYLFIAAIFFVGALGFSGDLRAASITRPVSNLGLIGYWSFDSGTSTRLHDLSGNDNHGTMQNMDGNTDWVPGKFNKALDFDGVNDYVVIPVANDTNTTLTESLWFYPRELPSEMVVPYMDLIDKDGDTWDIFLYNCGVGCGGLQVKLVFSDTTSQPRVAVSDQYINRNQWNHVVVTHDGTTTNLYLNGVLRSTVTPNLSLLDTGNNLYLGSNNGGGAYNFNGKIDDLRVYGRVLSVAEVYSLYRQGQATRKGVSNNGLVGHWTFNEGTSTVAHDFSGNGNNGTLTNMDATTDWVTGKRGKALDFDGSNDHVYGTIPASTFSGDWTVTAWFNHRAMTTWGAIFSNSVGTNDAFLMTMRNTTTQFGINRVGVSETGVYVDLGADHYNKWIFGVIKKEGSTITVTAYEDGIPNTSTGTLSWTLNTDNEFYIGRHYQGESQIFNGQIDDVRVYTRSLSTAEIDELYRMSETKINSSQDTKMTNGLVGMWSFNGKDLDWNANKAWDRSGRGYHGTMVNISTTTSPVVGKVGQALNFNGGNEYVEVPQPLTSSSPFTIALWYYPNAINGSYEILYSGTDNIDLQLFFHQTSKSLTTSIENSEIAAGLTLNSSTINKWHHIVWTYDYSRRKVYINGVLVTDTADTTSLTINDASVRFGKLLNGLGYTLQGRMDEVRVYNRAISAEEAKQLYLLGK